MPPAAPKKAKRARDARATREALRAAAAAAFTERGFDGSSLDEIARAAGVNKAMVSYHFGGKAGLHAAILEADFATLAEAIARIRASRAGATERLREFVRAFGSLHQRNPNLSVLLLREMLAGGRRLEPVVLPRFVTVLETVAEIVAQGVREGSFRPVDPFLFHQSLVGSLVFFFAVRPFRERLIEEGKVPVAAAPDAQSYIRHVESLVIRGLRPMAAETSEES
jgi:AcrR family transcriptional regulator